MVTILLSTYNSERFLREQIDSILNQKGVEMRLVVRDDGSSDSTFDILNEYQAKRQLTWYSDGLNLKPGRGFMKLLSDSDSDSDYYAFADHDDVWLDDKMSAAVASLKDASGPALYFCQTKLVDADLKPLDKQISISPYCTLGESLINHFVSGCTMVFNKALRDIIISKEPQFLKLHDMWIYAVAQAVGAKIVFDPQPHILYRQHGTNQVGLGEGIVEENKRRLSRLSEREHIRQNIAKELLNCFANIIPSANRGLIEKVAYYDKSIGDQISAMFDPRLRCHNRKTYYLSKLAFLFRTL